MPEPPAHTHPEPRLNGWKDIANHLGKGVRTVQRWEKVYGLPIHRIGQDGGDIVFAFASEIDHWLVEFERQRHASGDTAVTDTAYEAEVGPRSRAQTVVVATPAGVPPPRTPVPRRAARARSATVWVAAALLTIAVAAGLYSSTLPSSAANASATAPRAAQPAAWRVEDDRLIVLDEAGHELWSRSVGVDLQEATYTAAATDVFFHRVVLEDLDDDGTREVVFATATDARDQRGLHAFNADGTPRFTHHPAPTVRFGNQAYAPPWAVHGLAITRNADGTKSVWVTFIHGLWFPTLLQQLDARGRVVSEYWSNGYITSVEPGHWRGAPAVFVGGTNNETRGASLAIFRGTSVRGSAPAVDEAYQCSDCDTTPPDAFIVFPRACLRQIDEEQADVVQAWEEGNGTVVSIVSQGRVARPGADALRLSAYYAIAPDLSRASVELSALFVTAHDNAHRNGRIDHGLGEHDRQRLLPVLRWDQGRFVAMDAGDMRR